MERFVNAAKVDEVTRGRHVDLGQRSALEKSEDEMETGLQPGAVMDLAVL